MLDHELELQNKLKNTETHAKVVQRQLTQQIAVTTKGYGNLVREHQAKVDELKKVEQEFSQAKSDHEKQIRSLTT